MRVLKRSKAQDNGLILKLHIEHPDDLWCLYNIIYKGDYVEAFTSRKIKIENAAGTCVKQEVKKFNLKIEVEKVTYTSAYDDLQIVGRSTCANEYMKIGQYHRIDVHINSNIIVYKNNWNEYCEQKIQDICNYSISAEQAFLVIDCGKASLYLLLKYITKEVFTITHIIPHRKASAAKQSANNKATEGFYKSVINKLSHHLNFETTKVIVIVGPGFTRNDFFEYMKNNILRLNYINIHKNIKKFITFASTYSDKNAIREVLDNKDFAYQIIDIHYSEHNKALTILKEKLESNDDTVAIGLDEVVTATNLGACDILFVSDDLVRSASSDIRKTLQDLIDNIKQNRGKIYFLSDEHYATEFLKNLSGIVAILRFSILECIQE